MPEAVLPLEEHYMPPGFGQTDPTSLPGSPPSSTAPVGSSETDIRDGQQAPSEPPAEFDPRFRQDFQGLLFLGALQDTFRWAGHEFCIRTITTKELLQVGLVHRDYRDTLGDSRAYTTAMVGACIESVDGQALPTPLDMREDNLVAFKFNWISERWYPPTIDAVYERLLVLEDRVAKALEAMGKVSS